MDKQHLIAIAEALHSASVRSSSLFKKLDEKRRTDLMNKLLFINRTARVKGKNNE